MKQYQHKTPIDMTYTIVNDFTFNFQGCKTSTVTHFLHVILPPVVLLGRRLGIVKAPLRYFPDAPPTFFRVQDERIQIDFAASESVGDNLKGGRGGDARFPLPRLVNLILLIRGLGPPRQIPSYTQSCVREIVGGAQRKPPYKGYALPGVAAELCIWNKMFLFSIKCVDVWEFIP
ncbi:hypothetical protein CDAR_192391 [Caerostris darwini]|uniref:Uncharacterized protein n=1 Tax=Caerostris darwini TaxID=1538125 RepID=A0AAV4PME8_9ARAC|nr:hypothetical protein CDAR_192391 [Caerostris darwini]